MTTTIFETTSDTELVATRTFDAPIELVWEVWTNPEHVSNWLLGPEGWTMPVCDMDFRVGGAWHYVWRKDDGEEMAMTGEYREITPPTRMVQTENWGGEWPETLNTLELSDENGKTRMVMSVSYPSKEALEAAVATGMNDGAAVTFDRLDEYLASLS